MGFKVNLIFTSNGINGISQRVDYTHSTLALTVLITVVVMDVVTKEVLC